MTGKVVEFGSLEIERRIQYDEAMELRQITREVFYRYCPDPGCSPFPDDLVCYVTQDNDFLGAICLNDDGWEYCIFKRNQGVFALESKQGGFQQFPEHEMRGKLNELIILAELEWRDATARNPSL